MSGESPKEASAGDASAVASSMPGERAASSRLKRAVDIAVAMTALCLLCTLLATVAAAVAILDRGPILARHRRIGKDGVPFACLKFRTVAVDADAVLERHLAQNPGAAIEWAVHRRLRHDPRLTPLGCFLEATGLSELPQLVNVLRGEMSLVGPRPIAAEEVGTYGAAIAEYASVRPGLTGLWQCEGPGDVAGEQLARLDREYVRTWSIRRDFAIILRTIPAFLFAKGAC